jgi:hypothetical protein
MKTLGLVYGVSNFLFSFSSFMSPVLICVSNPARPIRALSTTVYHVFLRCHTMINKPCSSYQPSGSRCFLGPSAPQNLGGGKYDRFDASEVSAFCQRHEGWSSHKALTSRLFTASPQSHRLKNLQLTPPKRLSS